MFTCFLFLYPQRRSGRNSFTDKRFEAGWLNETGVSRTRFLHGIPAGRKGVFPDFFFEFHLACCFCVNGRAKPGAGISLLCEKLCQNLGLRGQKRKKRKRRGSPGGQVNGKNSPLAGGAAGRNNAVVVFDYFLQRASPIPVPPNRRLLSRWKMVKICSAYGYTKKCNRFLRDSRCAP